ncbi:DUF6541 family protein [Microbacterium sp. HJ5]
MIAAWLGAVPALVVALGVLLLPGGGIAWLAGFRGAALPAVSAGVSAGIIALASLVAPILSLRWSPLPVVLVASVLTAVAALLVWSGRRRGRQLQRFGAESNRWWVWAALGAAAVAWTAIVAVGMTSPDRPAQHFDAIFHLNAVRFVIESGSASPLDMTMAYPFKDHLSYPTLWHAVVSLVVPAAGQSVVVATNIVSLAVIAVLWPLAASFLTAAAWRRSLATAFGAALTLCFALFPLGFLNWGVLYPNLLGIALIPVGLGLLLTAFRTRALSVRGWQGTLLVCIGLAVIGGIAVAHPSALLAALVLSWPLALASVISMWSGPARPRIVATVTLAAVSIGLVMIWPWLNVTTGEWKRYESLAQALGEATYLGPVGRPPALLLAGLVIVGAWIAIRRRSWGLVGTQLVAVGFFVIAAWFPVEWIRSLFVGVWYDDVVRVAALLVVAAVPLAALAAASAVDVVRRRHPRFAWQAILAAVVIALPVLGAQALVIRHELVIMRSMSFAFDESSQGLSPDEAAMFDKVAALVPDGAVVAGDPLTGAGLLYAYTGQPVLFPHMRGQFGADASLLGTDLREGGEEVCQAIDRTGVEYVLDFGSQRIYPLGHEDFIGLHDLDQSDVVDEVAVIGDAALYEVTGCD